MELGTRLYVVALGLLTAGAGCASDEGARRQPDRAAHEQPRSNTEAVPYAQARPNPVVINDGLCSLRLAQRANAEIDTSVDQERQSVIVEATTDEADAVQNLRAQASELALANSYRLRAEGQEEALEQAESDSNDAAPSQVTVTVTAQDIEDGARLTFVPANGSQVDTLHAQLAQDAKAVEKGACAVATGSASLR